MSTKVDLLESVVYGGCSAKLPAGELSALLEDIPLLKSANIMVDIETHDDAGVYRLNDETALIVTTDFFPPVCSDPFEFGAIAAANSLSDVYAMGGKPLLALNINMFPSDKLPLSALHDILLGGQSKINEAGAFTMGGHTIIDPIPKYGLAVVGTVHPNALVTNSGAKVGETLVLTKKLGVGVIMAAHRLGICNEDSYQTALEQMKRLNKTAAEAMTAAGVRGATDITGFSLLGHALKMAQASGVSMKIYSDKLPIINGVEALIEEGCIPGAVFRNLEYVSKNIVFSAELSGNRKFVMCDAQTSGGIFMSVPSDSVNNLIAAINSAGEDVAVIGEVIEKTDSDIIVA